MDHLPVPSDPDRSNVVVPILAKTEADMYDKLDYMTYPMRCGYTCFHYAPDDQKMFPDLKHHYLDLRQFAERPWERTMLLLQEWLYFGLLHALFGSDFEREKFVHTTVEGQRVLTTAELRTMIGRREYARDRRHRGI
jgi:hypothetical protein